MDEYIIEINRSLTFQRVNQELRYKPDDPFIRTVLIGIRPKEASREDDWLAYIECMIWHTSSMKETIFSHYAHAYEKDQEDKTFSAICNYLRKNNSPKSFFDSKPMSRWAVYVSEFTVYEDIISQYPALDYATIGTEILNTLSTVIKQSFLIKPAYIFVSDKGFTKDEIKAAEFDRIGVIGATTVYMKNYK